MGFAMVSLRRTRTGLWTARKVVPADIRASYGKREEKRTWPANLSAGQAKAELAQWLVPIEERIATLRALAAQTPLSLSKRHSRALAAEWYRAQVARHEDDPGQAEDWWSSRHELEPDNQEERERGRIKPTTWLLEECDRLLQEKGLRLNTHSADSLLQEMGDLWVSLCDLMERRANGDYRPDPLADTLPTLDVGPSGAVAVSIMGLFEDYAGTGVATAKTISKWRKAIRSFVNHLGHDDATKVARADAHAWFDALQARGLSARTVRMTYRAALSRVFRVAHDRGRLAENPFHRLEVFGPKEVQTRRKDISDSEAHLILSAALDQQPRGLSAAHARARRWVPWICAYTGARVNEITQLRAMDIRQLNGVWVFHITPDAGSVKTRKARYVPIHSHLIEQGVTNLAKSGDPSPLFYNSATAKKGAVSHPLHEQMGSKLAKWVRSLGVNEVEQPNHGWRHRFKTVARSVGMDPEARDALQGHAPKTEGQSYGLWPLDALFAEVEKLPRYVLKG